MFEIGTIVYVNSTYNTAEKCEVEKYIEEDGLNICMVNSLELGGTFGALESNIFNTKEEALMDRLNKYNEQVEIYCKEINSLEDLIKFPLNHCFMGEEYTEYEAIKAYRIRAKELIDIDI